MPILNFNILITVESRYLELGYLEFCETQEASI